MARRPGDLPPGLVTIDIWRPEADASRETILHTYGALARIPQPRASGNV